MLLATHGVTMRNKPVAIAGHQPNKHPERSMQFATYRLSLKLQIIMLIDLGFDTFYTDMSWCIDMVFGEIITQLKKVLTYSINRNIY